MTKEKKEQLVQRFKLFAKGVAVMVGLSLTAFILENIGLFDLSPTMERWVGMVLEEVTMYLGNSTQ